jgi:hypothetical protein
VHNQELCTTRLQGKVEAHGEIFGGGFFDLEKDFLAERDG